MVPNGPRISVGHKSVLVEDAVPITVLGVAPARIANADMGSCVLDGCYFYAVLSTDTKTYLYQYFVLAMIPVVLTEFNNNGSSLVKLENCTQTSVFLLDIGQCENLPTYLVTPEIGLSLFKLDVQSV